MKPNLAPAAVQNPGIFERINNSFRNSSLGRIATGALATLTLAVGAETANLAFDTAPGVAQNVPAAKASKLGRVCKKLLQPPHNISSVMINPSRTEVKTEASYNGSKGCKKGLRHGLYRVQIKEGDHWLGIEGDAWYPTDEDIHGTKKNEAHTVGLLDFATRDVHEKRVNGRWEPARVQFMNELFNKKNKVIGRGKIKTKRITIEG